MADRHEPGDRAERPHNVRLGDRLKQARLAKNLTLKEVEREAKVSATHISEIERGMTSPTVGALARLARALGGQAADFIEARTLPRYSVTRAGSRTSLTDRGSGVTLHSLGGGMRGDELSFVEIELEPGRDRPHEIGHAGEELCHVLRGVVELTLGAARHLLKEGDSIHYRAEGPHAVRNIGDGPARVLWAAAPAAKL